MTMYEQAERSAFVTLFRQFFAQFFASESATSDEQVRKTIIGVLAFLITPGFLIPFQLDFAFEFASLRFPALVGPMIQLMATLFLTYAIVTIGLVAALEWDALGFDRRDAMVLGSLPVRGTTIVAAKLAALAAFLLIAATAINLLTAVPFSAVATTHKPLSMTLRHFIAHMIATMSAALFVFCVLVTIRAVLGMVGGGRVAVASLLQFTLISALLCFIVFVPTALKLEVTNRRISGVHMQAISPWSPTNWFLGLYEQLRGAGGGEYARRASIAIAVTLGSACAAVLTTVAGYRRQWQLALAPSASLRASRAAGLPRALARWMAGRNPAARATSDFIVTTIARNKAQQAPIAINAAIATVMIVLGVSRTRGDLASIFQARTLVRSVPLMLAYWATIGLRASFFVPSELPAAWSFRASAPPRTTASHASIRAAILAFVAPPAALVAFALAAPAEGWQAAARHTAFVLLVVAALSELIAVTIDFIPFTRPYQPGHARLKTRWPLYLVGAYGFAYSLVALELACGADAVKFAVLLACIVTVIAILEMAGRRASRTWSAHAVEEFADDGDGVTVLGIGAVRLPGRA